MGNAGTVGGQTQEQRGWGSQCDRGPWRCALCPVAGARALGSCECAVLGLDKHKTTVTHPGHAGAQVSIQAASAVQALTAHLVDHPCHSAALSPGLETILTLSGNGLQGSSTQHYAGCHLVGSSSFSTALLGAHGEGQLQAVHADMLMRTTHWLMHANQIAGPNISTCKWHGAAQTPGQHAFCDAVALEFSTGCSWQVPAATAGALVTYLQCAVPESINTSIYHAMDLRK